MLGKPWHFGFLLSMQLFRPQKMREKRSSKTSNKPSLSCCTSTRLDIYIHANQNSRAASTINLTLVSLARCPRLNPTLSGLVCQAAPVSSVAWAQEERIESKKETPTTVKVQLPLPKKPQSLEVIMCQSHL